MTNAASISLSQSERRENEHRDQSRVVFYVFYGTVIIFVLSLLLIFAVGNPWSIGIGVAILAALAAFTVGSFFGFIFGHPRTIPGTRAAADAKPTDASNDQPETENSKEITGNVANSKDIGTNTNLQDISDWLAKIFVGAGLVGLNSIVKWIGERGSEIGTGMEGLSVKAAPIIGSSLLVFGFIVGFLFVYIYTRTIISVMFVDVGKRINEQLAEQQQQLTSMHAQVEEVKKVAHEATDVAGRVLSFLYLPEPDGFRRAIKEAEEYLREEANRTNTELYLYQACAYGQQHAYEKDKGTEPAELEAIMEKAYAAAEKAIQLDAKIIDRLRGLADINEPGHWPGDDDLVTLAGHDKFKRLLWPEGTRTPPAL